MLLIIATAGFSLWVNACLLGTLHGVPRQICREFQIRHFDTVEACLASNPPREAEKWLKTLERYNLHMTLTQVRCGPAEEYEER